MKKAIATFSGKPTLHVDLSSQEISIRKSEEEEFEFINFKRKINEKYSLAEKEYYIRALKTIPNGSNLRSEKPKDRLTRLSIRYLKQKNNSVLSATILLYTKLEALKNIIELSPNISALNKIDVTQQAYWNIGLVGGEIPHE